jgi:DNA polymerase III delta prime subunit
MEKQFNDMELWTIDCAPRCIDEIMGNREICQIFRNYIKEGHIPNILLVGEHGTGKRTLARLLAMAYLGDDYERACLRIDGAIYRGKDVISSGPGKKVEKLSYTGISVHEFARTQVTLPDGRTKLILIYNFDDMTVDAQNALRRIMETYSATTRFILLSNNLENIIEPIQSRCIPLRTSLLDESECRQMIGNICRRKVVPELPKDIVDIIVILAAGDIKKLVNYVQMISSLECPDIRAFHSIFNIPPIRLLEKILLDTQRPETQQKALDLLSFLLRQGYNYVDIMEMLSKVLCRYEELPESTRIRYLEIINTDYCYITQVMPDIYMYSLFARFARET